MSSADVEKNPVPNEAKVGSADGYNATPDGEKDTSSADDALKLAGTHANQFDDKYNARLLRKIVSPTPIEPVEFWYTN